MLSGTHDPSFSRPDIRGRELPPWPEEFGVELATPQPGQALVFTEKLMHSTHPYKGRGQRRTMFMKYQPYGTDRRAGNCKRHSSTCLARLCVAHGSAARGSADTIKYDLSRPELDDDRRRLLAWPEQWEEYGLGDYGELSVWTDTLSPPPPPPPRL